MVSLLVEAVTITLAADAGGAIGIAIDGHSQARLRRLIWMAAGAMLAVTCLDMLPEAFARLGPTLAGISALLGAALIAWMARRSPSVCPACGVAHPPAAGDAAPEWFARKEVWLIICALAVHCMLDGIGVAASGAMPGTREVGVFFGMAIHKLPEGLALTLLLLGSGMRREAALGWTLFAEAFTLVGALSVGWIGAPTHAPTLSVLVAFVGGGFLVLVLKLLWEALRSAGDRLVAGPWALAGFAVTSLVSWLSR